MLQYLVHHRHLFFKVNFLSGADPLIMILFFSMIVYKFTVLLLFRLFMSKLAVTSAISFLQESEEEI